MHVAVKKLWRRSLSKICGAGSKEGVFSLPLHLQSASPEKYRYVQGGKQPSSMPSLSSVHWDNFSPPTLQTSLGRRRKGKGRVCCSQSLELRKLSCPVRMNRFKNCCCLER